MVHAVYATTDFLSTLTALFPTDSTIPILAAWIAGIVFAAHNLPKETVATYSYTVNTSSCLADAPNTTRVFHEAVFKAGTMYGTPRMINELLAVSGEMKA
jgi:thiamine transporter ThiT